MKKVFILLCIAAIFCGCGVQKKAKESFNMYDKLLTLTELNGSAVTLNADRPATITFDKAGGRVSGNLGCNRFSGTFQINGNSLKFSQLISTKMMCFDSMNVEDAFSTALNNTDSFEIKDGALLLKQGKNVLAVLK